MGQFGTPGKYGEITTERKKLHPGEPYFLLRSTDPKTVETILFYIDCCEEAECSLVHIDECAAAAERIRLWQAANRHLVKERPGDNIAGPKERGTGV